MKIACSLLYTIVTVLYFSMGNGDIFWRLVNYSTLFICLIWFIQIIKENKIVSKSDRLFLKFTQVCILTRALYTFICSVAPFKWIYEVNIVYASLTALGLVWIGVHCFKSDE